MCLNTEYWICVSVFPHVDVLARLWGLLWQTNTHKFVIIFQELGYICHDWISSPQEGIFVMPRQMEIEVNSCFCCHGFALDTYVLKDIVKTCGKIPDFGICNCRMTGESFREAPRLKPAWPNCYRWNHNFEGILLSNINQVRPKMFCANTQNHVQCLEIMLQCNIAPCSNRRHSEKYWSICQI